MRGRAVQAFHASLKTVGPMCEKLRVEFDDPSDGWVSLTLTLGSRQVTMIVSYTPHDSFLDLIDALHNLFLYDGERKIIWNGEPIEYELQFARSGGLVSLEVFAFPDHRRGIKPATSLLRAKGSYDEVAIPFWKGLRDLQGRFTAEELSARWHRPFPAKETDDLTAILRSSS